MGNCMGGKRDHGATKQPLKQGGNEDGVLIGGRPVDQAQMAKMPHSVSPNQINIRLIQQNHGQAQAGGGGAGGGAIEAPNALVSTHTHASQQVTQGSALAQANADKQPTLDRIDPTIFVSIKKGSIQNQYKMGELLGEGAFGSVCVVRHKNTGILRAMKTIKKSQIIKEEEEKMFAEVSILRQIDHPHIIRLYELYQDENHYYLITEYCHGGELFEKIKLMKEFSEKEVAEYMKQILSAIVYCHNHQIVHRDLKPENLLFDSRKDKASLKVIDFGTSRKFDPTRKLTKRLGTPYYIAPEVIKKSYDEKCDVWSCGVILFILLCGYPPFNGNDELQILQAVEEANLVFEENDWKAVSKEAKELVKKMLEKDPTLRISAEEALNDPWIQKNAAKQPLSTKVLQNLGTFHAKNKLRQAIMTFIATHVVTQQEKNELINSFKSLDKNNDGQLSKEELVEGYLNVVKDRARAENIVDQIFEQVDSNKSGKVDFTEFVVAALNQEKLLSKAKIEQAFKIFDQDGNGQIDREELQQIMGGVEMDDKTWNEILGECDTDNDGKISQQEFIDLLLKRIDNNKGV